MYYIDMARKRVKVSKNDDTKLFAFLATFFSIIGFVVALAVRRDDKYVMFYAKQSLVVFIASIIAWIIGMILVFLPVLGVVITVALNIIIFVLWLVSWIYALSGEMKEVPIIGHYGRSFNF
jgi:uncharacterized membrane protein